VPLADPGLRLRERFLYEYDSVDGWHSPVAPPHSWLLASHSGRRLSARASRYAPIAAWVSASKNTSRALCPSCDECPFL
jgi:hypothetical protein